MIAPKLRRSLVLTSWQAVRLWAMLEAHPQVRQYCERPATIELDGRTRVVDFWARRNSGDVWLLLDDEGAAELELDDEAKGAPRLGADQVQLISRAALDAEAMWIENWLRILPYLVANGGLVDPMLVDAIVDECGEPMTLVSIEARHISVDPMLVRAALFIAVHAGRVIGLDLREKPLEYGSRFQRLSREPSHAS